jgi:ABC-type lipopolysaccharide export system ATPase subunit
LVLIDGQLVAQGSPAEVAAHSAVRERYLGQHFSLSQEPVRA